VPQGPTPPPPTSEVAAWETAVANEAAAPGGSRGVRPLLIREMESLLKDKFNSKIYCLKFLIEKENERK